LVAVCEIIWKTEGEAAVRALLKERDDFSGFADGIRP